MKKIDQIEEIVMVFNPDGTVVFPWWTPLVENIIKETGLQKQELESSIFCG